MQQFISLHNQTSYSILDSLISPKELFKRASELGQTAIAITEHNSLASSWDAFKASKDSGVKLIIGCECYFKLDLKNEDEKFKHLILIAKNAIGYKNLLTINRLGFDNCEVNSKKMYSIISWDLLEKYNDGLICLTACGNGIISSLLMNRQFSEAESTLLKLKEIFKDNLGVEILPNNMKRPASFYSDEIDQQFLNKKLIDLGVKHNIRVVAACNAHYLNKEDHEVHDALLAIGSHQPIYSNFRLKYTVPDFYLKSGDEVKFFFSRNYGDDLAQSFCDNSIYFADLCENPNWIDPKYTNLDSNELPVFPVKEANDYSNYLQWLSLQKDDVRLLEEDKSYLRYKCYLKFDKIKNTIEEKNHQIYLDRIIEELDVLEYRSFSSYMLIVADYIEWAIKNQISIGPGRGSCGGSLVAYLLDIHHADPIKYDLIFARFQNKDKKAFPDIDQDVSTSGRERLCNYIQNKYGKEKVAYISNLNKITPKVFIKDMARAYELGGSKDSAVQIGEAIADVVPADTHSDIDSLLAIPLFSEYSKQYTQFIKNSKILGKQRAFSTHAGAVVIGKRSLIGLVPLRKDKNGDIAIEYTKDDTEESGLLKMDVLGLSTLDLIDETIKLIKESGKSIGDEYKNYDLNDQKTYDLISRGDTHGVFQLGTSSGTIDLCKKIKPKNIEDLAIITTLARPASANIRSEFIEVLEGKKQSHLLHASLKGAFEKTLGYGLFDECILRLGSDVAGWSLNEADRIRKFIKEKGKNPAKDKKLKEDFIQGAMKTHNLDLEFATKIWDSEIGKFGGYTFNKSHAVVCSFLSYQTAYLKANFPIEFLLANLKAKSDSAAPNSKNNIEKIKKEIKALNIKILPPDINKSNMDYTLNDDNNLLTGLQALKFVGEDSIKEILIKRPFKSFFDFMTRIDSSVRANNIQALAACGALDSFKMPRKLMFLYVSDYRKRLGTWSKKHDPKTEDFNYPFPNEPEWSIPECYALEQFYMAETFVCQPTKAYDKFFNDYHCTIGQARSLENQRLDAVKNHESKQRNVSVSSMKGIVVAFFEMIVRKEDSKFYGKHMVKAIIEDKNRDQCSLTIFPDRWELLQNRLKDLNKNAKFDIGLAMHFSCSVSSYKNDLSIIYDKLYSIALPPDVPKDLKVKKVNLRDKSDLTQLNLFDKLEESLYDKGMIDNDN